MNLRELLENARRVEVDGEEHVLLYDVSLLMGKHNALPAAFARTRPDLARRVRLGGRGRPSLAVASRDLPAFVRYLDPLAIIDAPATEDATP